jgi:hypothetical protein
MAHPVITRELIPFYAIRNSTGIPLSQRVTLPILVSYSAANKAHDPRHPTSQTTAVTKRSILGHGAQVPYSITKETERRPVIPDNSRTIASTAKRTSAGEGSEGSRQDVSASATLSTSMSVPATHQHGAETTPAAQSGDLTPGLAGSPAVPVQQQPRSQSARTAKTNHEEPMDISGNDLSHDAGLNGIIDRDPLEDPMVQEGLKILDWGDDGLSGYTSVDFRMHRGIR